MKIIYFCKSGVLAQRTINHNMSNKFVKAVSGMIFISCILVSCRDGSNYFSEDLLLGKWVEGSEYYRYDSDHTGVTWDVSDDVSEEEALPYSWSLEGDRLTHLHRMNEGQIVPKTYTITKLSATSLKYNDSYGVMHSFSKVMGYE